MQYKGQTILRCEMADPYEHGGKWMIVTHHKTGMAYFCQQNPHFRTLAEAKESIRFEDSLPREEQS